MLVFQAAEEAGGGVKKMLDDGALGGKEKRKMISHDFIHFDIAFIRH